MLHNYKSYTLILESKKRDNKISKKRKVIEKFLKFDPIIDYVFDKVVDRDSTKGLRYTVWFADKIKKHFIESLATDLVELERILNDKLLSEENIQKDLEDALSGKEIESDLSDKIPNYQFYLKDKYLELKWQEKEPYFTNYYVNPILDWLKSPIREEEEVDLSQYTTLAKAHQRAFAWHEDLKATGIITDESGEILLSFDDGYYWIDLQTTESEEEANAMGHCGRTSDGSTLYSLRKKQSPHVTASINTLCNDPNDGNYLDYSIVFQMKGRENKKPVKKYYPYIEELLSYPNVSDNVTVVNKFKRIGKFSTTEYMPEEDFHISDLSSEQILKLKEKNPKLINNCGLDVKYKLYKEGVISAEELCEDYKDLKLVDGEIYMVINGLADFNPSIFKPNNSFRHN